MLRVPIFEIWDFPETEISDSLWAGVIPTNAVNCPDFSKFETSGVSVRIAKALFSPTPLPPLNIQILTSNRNYFR